ncbi:proline dehydrogenase family protein [Cutibacterium equinum]|uniref:proline dehydrogenase n=1 Tax=Cutibacterium equinum TaxID=3016342 RepID=A0ABY7R0Z6_9ACTN|nr:proline dehydrogenase family protein [Cutibacterium equinum]WCC80976.1 proline dehydrogenase family protein [Cutibacterium equinum]
MKLAMDATIADKASQSKLANDIATTYVAGEDAETAIEKAADLVSKGLDVSLHPLDPVAVDVAQARRAMVGLCAMIEKLDTNPAFRGHSEVSISLAALGLRVDDDLALDNARQICQIARDNHVAVTVDDEGPDIHDRSHRIVMDLLEDYEDTGIVIQAARHDSLTQVRELAVAGRRIRLCKGSYTGPRSVTLIRHHDVDLRMAACLRALMTGPSTVMLASHDPVFIALGEQLMASLDRPLEFQMLQGIRPLEQRRLVDIGHRVRVYLPYGHDWYRYCTRRIVERPSNMWLFGRSLVERR